MKLREIEREGVGTVTFTDDGWMKVYNAKGQEVAAIKPGKEQWLQIAAAAVDKARYSSVA